MDIEEKIIEDIKKNPELVLPHVNHKTTKFWLGMVSPVMGAYLGRVYSHIDVQGLENIADFPDLSNLKEKKNDGKFRVAMPRHQAEADWYILQKVFFDNSKYVIIPAGNNLFHAKGSSLLLRWGAYKYLRSAEIFKIKGVDAEVDEKLYLETVYPKLLEKEFFNGHPDMPFAETGKTHGSKRKSGRSYTGELLKFSALLMRNYLELQEETGLEGEIYSIGFSYERVLDDTQFVKQEKSGDPSEKANEDLLHQIKLVSSKYPRVGATIIFGKPYALDKNMNYKEHTRKIREEVGKLSRIYGTNLFFTALGERKEMGYGDLIMNLTCQLHQLDSFKGREGFDLRSKSTQQMTSNDIAHRTLYLFKDILETRGSTIHVKNPPIAAQSRNQIAHLFEMYGLPKIVNKQRPRPDLNW